MNILTKISVVVLVLLIVVFCVVVIQVATLTPNYKYKFEGAQQNIVDLSQENRLANLALQRANAELGAEKTAAAKTAGELAKDLDAANTKLAAQTAENARLKNQFDGMDATLKKVEQDLVAKEDRNKALSDSLAKAYDDINKANQKEIKLTEEVNKQTINAERYRAESDFLRQELAKVEEKLHDAEERARLGGTQVAGGAGATGAVPNTGGVDILGNVTAVKKDIASIDIGSAKGVKVGMVATVFRGKDYVCQIDLKDVDVNQAAGVVIKRKMEPQATDKIVISSER